MYGFAYLTIDLFLFHDCRIVPSIKSPVFTVNYISKQTIDSCKDVVQYHFKEKVIMY